MRHVLVPLQR